MTAKRAVVPVVILIDLLSKFFAKKYLTVTENPALPFGLHVSGFFNFFLVGLILILFCIFYFRSVFPDRPSAGFYLIAGGAIANLIDRAIGGTVTDFINLRISTANFADLAIMIGIVLLLLQHSYIRKHS